MSAIAINFLKEMVALPVFYSICTLLITILFMVNSSVFFSERNTLSTCYIGLKISFLIFIILEPFELNIIVNILELVWGIICIILGFRFEQKYLRIYGLLLSLIIVIKTVLIDMTYYNTTPKSINFIICGLLCFVISYIYNKIEQKLK